MRGGSYSPNEYAHSLNAVYYDSNRRKSGKACPLTAKRIVSTASSQNVVCASDNYCYYINDGIKLYISYEMKRLFKLHQNDKAQILIAINSDAILSPVTRIGYSLADIILDMANSFN